MQKFGQFVWGLCKQAASNEVLPLATQLTYRLIFSLFPFLIFLISLVGFFNINADYLLSEVYAIFPQEIASAINDVIKDVVGTRSQGILSGSLVLVLFTLVSGFRAIMRGVNKVYGQKDTRHIVLQYAYCALLVLVLALAIILSLLAIIYGDIVHDAMERYFAPPHPFVDALFGIVGIAVTMGILLFGIILIYRFSSCKKHRLLSLLPGAALTMAVWGISTWAFNIYISNFSQHSLVYGSIASIFLTMLWLNIISIAILFGAQLNAKLAGGLKSEPSP
ncbi:MAG: YihY/virulence factor BrkB family protein [Defluviitaleaceae bacterium]|nr:YihY/virulence factor BrkB family protein [Defluviitaleaceae bacterium]